MRLHGYLYAGVPLSATATMSSVLWVTVVSFLLPVSAPFVQRYNVQWNYVGYGSLASSASFTEVRTTTPKLNPCPNPLNGSTVLCVRTLVPVHSRDAHRTRLRGTPSLPLLYSPEIALESLHNRECFRTMDTAQLCKISGLRLLPNL